MKITKLNALQQAALNALRSDFYRQGRNELRSCADDRAPSMLHCVLGVLGDVYMHHGASSSVVWHQKVIVDVTGRGTVSASTLPRTVLREYAMPRNLDRTIMILNDTCSGATFAWFADLLELIWKGVIPASDEVPPIRRGCGPEWFNKFDGLVRRNEMHLDRIADASRRATTPQTSADHEPVTWEDAPETADAGYVLTTVA